jgi:transmembrane protein EpsG
MSSYIEFVISILPYFIMLFNYIILSLTSYVSKSRVFFYLAILIIILFVGFKDIMSPDFERYAYMYENIESFGFDASEPFFIIMSFFLKSFGFDYYALFFIYAFLTILFILLGIREFSKHHAIAMLLYLLVPGFFLNMFIEMRQILAVAMVFYAVGLILNKKRYGYFLAFLSIITHYSAMFFWFIFIIFKKYFSKKYFLWFYVISLVASFALVVMFRLDLAFFNFLFMIFNSLSSFLPFLQKYLTYLALVISGEVSQVQAQLIKNIFYILNTLFLLYVLRYIIKENNNIHPMADLKKDNYLINFLTVGTIILNISFYVAEVSRFAYYFLIFQIVLIPNIILKIPNLYVRYSFFIIILFIYISMFIKGLFLYSEEWQDYIFFNYKNILFERF